MIEKIKEKQNSLAEEAERLYTRKVELEKEINSIDVRITQIIGAMSELQSLIQGESNADQTNVEN